MTKQVLSYSYDRVVATEKYLPRPTGNLQWTYVRRPVRASPRCSHDPVDVGDFPAQIVRIGF